MRLRVLSAWLAAVVTLGVAAPLSLDARALRAPSDDKRTQAESQVDFGIKVAQKKLWREATYRFEKAVEIDPTYPAAWNNLAIAYEEQGKLDDANKAYTKAVGLDPDNILIRQNFDLFKENYDRISRRNRR